MLRHEFQPGKLIAGIFLTGAAIAYGGDAGGLWQTPWFAVIPFVASGLFLAGATGTVVYVFRSRRRYGR